MRVNLFETMTERDELQSSVSSLEEELEFIRENWTLSEAKCRELEAAQLNLQTSITALKDELAALRLEDEEKASKCQELENLRTELQMTVSALEEEQKVLHNLDHLQ